MIPALVLFGFAAFLAGVAAGTFGLVRYIAASDDCTYIWFTEELSYHRRRLQGRDQ